MKRKTARLLGGMLAASLMMTGFTGCGSDTIDGTQTAFVINDEKIPLGEANFILRYEQATMYNYYYSFYSAYGIDMPSSFFDGSSGKDEDGTQTQGEYLKETATTYLEQLVEMRQHAEELGVSLTDEQIAGAEAAAADFVEKNGDEVMTALGATQDMLTDAFELYAYSYLMYKPIIADVDTNVTDEEAQMSTVSLAYVTIDSDMDEDELAEKKEQIQKYKDELDKDTTADFSDLADTVNEELNTEAGNDEDSEETYIYSSSQSYQRNSEDDDSLAEEIKTAAAELKDGEVYADIVETDQGYYVIRMDAVTDEDETESKKTSILSDRKETLYDDTLQQWIDESDISIKKCYKNLTVTDKDGYYMTVDSSSTEE